MEQLIIRLSGNEPIPSEATEVVKMGTTMATNELLEVPFLKLFLKLCLVTQYLADI
jgi:N-methylhydantoinase A/oxoprolinase/acetone carboxylase beta subunit